MKTSIKHLRTAAKAVICPILFASVLSGCPIFDLKIPSKPSEEGGGDPLNIVDVIKAVDRNAMADIGYDGYFTSDVKFSDYMLGQMSGRQVVQMLERLRSRSPSSLRVEWRFDRAENWREGNLHFVNKVTYIVYISGAAEYRGSADFQIMTEPDSRISYWRDEPDGVPFFFEP